MVVPVVFYCAVPFYQGALRDLKNLRLSMDTPIAVAIIMTFIVGVYSLATNAGAGDVFRIHRHAAVFPAGRTLYVTHCLA